LQLAKDLRVSEPGMTVVDSRTLGTETPDEAINTRQTLAVHRLKIISKSVIDICRDRNEAALQLLSAKYITKAFRRDL
jgi:hypothetical protein